MTASLNRYHNFGITETASYKKARAVADRLKAEAKGDTQKLAEYREKSLAELKELRTTAQDYLIANESHEARTRFQMLEKVIKEKEIEQTEVDITEAVL